MPTTVTPTERFHICYTVGKLEEIFIGSGETVRSIFNHKNQVSIINIDDKKACIKFIVCILDTIHDFNSSSTVMKEWVEWMLQYGGVLQTNPPISIKGDPNNLWNSSNSSNIYGLDKDMIIQTMVSNPEDVALYFIFGCGDTAGNLKNLSDIGHEYRFEYYSDKSKTNYKGYKAFYMAHQDKYNNDWICNELVKKQNIFTLYNGSNTNYKYYNGTTPKFIDKNKIEVTQGPSFMVDQGCTNYILNDFTLNLSNQTILTSQLTGAVPDPVFGTIPTNMNFNCSQYSGIAKNYDMGWSKNITEGCDESPIIHNYENADATIGSLSFEITDEKESKINYIDPVVSNPLIPAITSIPLPNNVAGKAGLKNALKFLIKQYDKNKASGVSAFFTLAKGTAKQAIEITFDAFKKALLPNLWKPSSDKTELWKKLSINYDLKRNGDWNQSVDCLRKDSDCSGSGWEETVFITHDGIAAAISSVIVGVNTIWFWAIAGERTEYSSVYIPRCDTSIPLSSIFAIPINKPNISLPISFFVNEIETLYQTPLTGGGLIEIKYINSNPVTKQTLKDCLYELCKIDLINNYIESLKIGSLKTTIDIDMKELLCNIYISKYNWDIITNPENNEEIINFYTVNYDKYEKNLIKFFKDRRSIGNYLTKQNKSTPKNIKRGIATIKEESVNRRETRSNTLITNTRDRRARDLYTRRGIEYNRFPAEKSTLYGGQNSNTVGNLIKEALINFYDNYQNIDDKNKDKYINNIYTSLLYKLINYKLNSIKVGSDEYMCHIIAIVLEENIVSLIKLTIPNINWNRIEDLIEVTDDNDLIKEINNINKEKQNIFLTKVNNEITESYEAMKKKSTSKNFDFNTYLKNSFDETLNEFKNDISYIVDIILSTKKYKGKVSDKKELQVFEIIDTILQNAESEKPVKKVKSVITDVKSFQDKGVKGNFPSLLKKTRINGIVTTANKQVPSLIKSKIRISSKVPVKFNIKASNQDKLNTPKKPSQLRTNQDKLKTPKKPSQLRTNQDKLKTPKKPSQLRTNQDKLNTPKKPSQLRTNQDKLKTPKKPSQMLTRQDKSKKDKLKLRIEQFKNKDFSPYFEKKINSRINDRDVDIYNIGIRKMKSILKDIYEIEK
jgi:hypothetical protein